MSKEQTDILQDPELVTEELAGAPETSDGEPATPEDSTEGDGATETPPAADKSSQSAEKEDEDDDEEEQHSNLSLKQILGGDILTGNWLKRQMGLIVMCCLFVIAYITCRYLAEQNIIEIERLKVELEEIKYRALTRSGELTVRSRQSHIEEYLKKTNDSTLSIPKEPPYRIKRKEE